MTFLVTGMGHSGTKFLATQLNKAKGWTVEHEPDSHTLLEAVVDRFRIQNYGEVNSYLLCTAFRLNVHKLGVILRDPFAVARSILTDSYLMCTQTGTEDYIRSSLELMDALLSYGAIPVYFNAITKDAEAVAKVAGQLGITTFDTNEVTLERINRRQAKKVDYFPSPMAANEYDRFIDKHSIKRER